MNAKTFLLYGDPGSGSAVVELTLAEAGADYPERFYPTDLRRASSDEALRDHVRDLWKSRWTLVESALVGSDAAHPPWLLAEGFSLVDIYIAVVSRWAQVDEWRCSQLPRVEAVAAAVAERDACAAIWQRHFGAQAA